MSASDSAQVHFERAKALARLGRGEDALDAYRETLRMDPRHFGALTDLAIILYNANVRTTAFELFEAAIRHHPRNPVAQTNFGYVLVKAGELERARGCYETALALDPGNAEARRGLATVAAQRGEQPRTTQSAGDAVVRLPYRGSGAETPLLLLCSLGSGNVATAPLLDDTRFAITKLIVELFPSREPLPPHRLAFNAIGDADACGPALEAARKLLASSKAPVVNPPERVLSTGRAEIARCLRALPDVVTPRLEPLPRALLGAPDAPQALAQRGFTFPLLLRSPGFHTGEHFTLVPGAGALAAALATLPGEELYAIEFLDTRDAAGLFRKYRVMFLGGALHPLHLALAADWKVHYFSADMAENAEHRALDRAFLEDLEGTVGTRVVAALERIAATLGLDYAGIDFGLDRAGRVVVFEANATMVVALPPPDARWEYRRTAVTRVRDAARAMLAAKVSRA